MMVREDDSSGKTFGDTFAQVDEAEPVKFDVCVTALIFLPLLLLPNLITNDDLQQVNRFIQIVRSIKTLNYNISASHKETQLQASGGVPLHSNTTTTNTTRILVTSQKPHQPATHPNTTVSHS